MVKECSREGLNIYFISTGLGPVYKLVLLVNSFFHNVNPELNLSCKICQMLHLFCEMSHKYDSILQNNETEVLSVSHDKHIHMKC